MEVRFRRNISKDIEKGSVTLQRKVAADYQPQLMSKQEPVRDLTDFMNDAFSGAIKTKKHTCNNLKAGGGLTEEERDQGYSVRSRSSKVSHQEWIQEAKQIVVSSPSSSSMPSSRLLNGSPRFASSEGVSSLSLLDRRDPRSRSARRQRAVEGFSGEILSKSAKRNRNKSETFDPPPPAADDSPAAAILKLPNGVPPPPTPPPFQPNDSSIAATQNPTAPPRPPLQSISIKSRFHNTNPNSTQRQDIPTHPLSKRTFKTTPAATPRPDTQLLSPPKNLIESARRRSISSSTCSLLENQVLSPPKNSVNSAHRRSISSLTCSTDKISRKPSVNEQPKEAAVAVDSESRDLNRYLKEQRVKLGKLLNGEIYGKAKIVFSGPSNSTSSMVAAICYAWLLENRMRANRQGVDVDGGTAAMVVPVMNMRRGKMWKQRQVAWLFHHLGLDSMSLLFADEVDLETLMMAKQLSILVVGQDILKTNGEVGSQCTILTENYCEDAYDLLQNPILKKFLLAGILLDTQNLNMSGKLSMTRDAEAVQLLSVGSTCNYRKTIYDQLMQDQRDGTFFEALRHNYGKPPNETDKPKSVQAQGPAVASAQATNAPRGKNNFFLARWFGFGSK